MIRRRQLLVPSFGFLESRLEGYHCITVISSLASKLLHETLFSGLVDFPDASWRFSSSLFRHHNVGRFGGSDGLIASGFAVGVSYVAGSFESDTRR